MFEWIDVVILIWLTCCIAGFRFIRARVVHRKDYVFKGVPKIPTEPYRLIIRYVTKSGQMVEGFRATLSNTKALLRPDDELQVITDDPLDSEFEDIAQVYVVPADYSGKPAVRKARALQYAIEHTKANEHTWIYHMDEETNIIPQSLDAVQDFIARKKGLLGIGPIFYPHKFFEVNPILRVNEAMRSALCYGCAGQVSDHIPDWLHGSNLLIRSDLEKEIGWDSGETIAEDQLFGIRAGYSWGKWIFGWTGAIALEQPPLTFRDNFRQRLRWYTGCLQNMRYMVKTTRLRVAVNLGLWTAGFISAIISLPLLVIALFNIPYSIASEFEPTSRFPVWLSNYTVFMQHLTPQTPVITGVELLLDTLDGTLFSRYLVKSDGLFLVIIGALLLFSLVSWLLPYAIGLRSTYALFPMSKTAKLKGYIQSFILLPVAAIVETLPAIWGFLRYILRKQPKWDRPTRK